MHMHAHHTRAVAIVTCFRRMSTEVINAPTHKQTKDGFVRVIVELRAQPGRLHRTPVMKAFYPESDGKNRSSEQLAHEDSAEAVESA